jgi:chromosome segregation ATPase
MTAAEKQLRAADAAVRAAQDRLLGAQADHSTLSAEAADLDQRIQREIYDATLAGTNADVTEGRGRLHGLRERLELIGPVLAALQVGVEKAERARTELVAEHFRELRQSLVQRAGQVSAERAEMRQRHAQEERQVAAKVHELEWEWHRYVEALPQPLRPCGLTPELEVPDVEPSSGLGIYVAEPGWPAWTVALLEESARLRFEEGERLRLVNMPIAG